MFAHWVKLGDMLGKRILPVIEKTLDKLVIEQKAIPNWRQRFCTRMLKIEPYARWLESQSKTHDRIISYVGLRADEPERVGGDYAHVFGVEMVFPMRLWGWGISEVTDYLKSKDVSIPKRTDCARCFYQRLSEWRDLWLDHPEIYRQIEEQEELMGHTWRSPGRDTWPAKLSELRIEFERGRRIRGEKKDTVADTKCRVCRI